MGQAKRGQQHGLKLGFPDGRVGPGEFSYDAVPGIVDHQIEASARFPGGAVKGGDGPRRIRQVERHGRKAGLTGRSQPARVARRSPYPHPFAHQHGRKCPAETGSRAGDERGAVQVG